MRVCVCVCVCVCCESGTLFGIKAHLLDNGQKKIVVKKIVVKFQAVARQRPNRGLALHSDMKPIYWSNNCQKMNIRQVGGTRAHPHGAMKWIL